MLYGILCSSHSLEMVNVSEFGMVSWRRYEEEDFILPSTVIGTINIH